MNRLITRGELKLPVATLIQKYFTHHATSFYTTRLPLKLKSTAMVAKATHPAQLGKNAYGRLLLQMSSTVFGEDFLTENETLWLENGKDNIEDE